MIDDRRKPSVPPPGDGEVEMVAADVSTVSSRRRAQRKLRVPNDPVPRPGGDGSDGGDDDATASADPRDTPRDTQPDPIPAAPEPVPATARESGPPSRPSDPSRESISPAAGSVAKSDPLAPPPRRSMPPPAGRVSVPPPPPPGPTVASVSTSTPPEKPEEKPAEAPVSAATAAFNALHPESGGVVRQVKRRVRAVGTGTAPVIQRAHGEEEGAPVISVSETSDVEISIPLPSVALIDAAEDDFVVPPDDGGPAIETGEVDLSVEVDAEPASARTSAAPPETAAAAPVAEKTDAAKPTPAAAKSDAPAADDALADAEVVEEAAEEIALAEEDLKSAAGKAAPPPPPSSAAAKAPPAPPPAPAAAKRPEPPPAAKPKDEKKKRPWWESVFGDDYFRVMPKLTPRQAELEANFIENSLGVERGAVVLDLGCGAGRQAIEMSMRGYEIIALDLSLPMLSRAADAAQERGAKLNFLHADMREMDFAEMFDAAYCMGTSFGYFEDDRNADVIGRLHRGLKVGGTFLLDVINRDYVIQNQPSMAWYEGDGCVCMEESNFNYITSRLEMKRTLLLEDGRQREFQYTVRCYSLHELGQLLHQVGFRVIEVSGHARTPGAFFGPASRSIMILAQKQAKAERSTGEFRAAPPPPVPAATTPATSPSTPAAPPAKPGAES